jgi:hypothetical protein
MQSQYQSQDKNKGISLMENITKLQEEYYEKNNKNILFKKNQKYDCASIITKQYDCNILFEKTLYILKNGEVYFDYTIFKTYIHPEIFDNFLEYINNISLNYIDIMSEYTLHLNFQTLTISAFDRYWPLVKQIMNTFPVNVDKMQKTYIYYTPSVIDQIIKVMHPFISHYRDKITFFSKSESSEKISELFR